MPCGEKKRQRERENYTSSFSKTPFSLFPLFFRHSFFFHPNTRQNIHRWRKTRSTLLSRLTKTRSQQLFLRVPLSLTHSHTTTKNKFTRLCNRWRSNLLKPICHFFHISHRTWHWHGISFFHCFNKDSRRNSVF